MPRQARTAFAVVTQSAARQLRAMSYGSAPTQRREACHSRCVPAALSLCVPGSSKTFQWQRYWMICLSQRAACAATACACRVVAAAALSPSRHAYARFAYVTPHRRQHTPFAHVDVRDAAGDDGTVLRAEVAAVRRRRRCCPRQCCQETQ